MTNIFINLKEVYRLIWPEIINLLIAIFAAYSAYKSYEVSKRVFDFEKKTINENLKPKIYLKEKSKYYINYKNVNSDGKYTIDSHEPFNLELLNVGATKLLSLNISFRFEKIDVYKKLIEYAINDENGNIIHEESGYSWDGVLPLEESSSSYVEVLDENSNINLRIPSIFVALLIGNNIMVKQRGRKNNINKLKLKMSITFQTTYSKDENIERDINFTFDNTTEVLQGPTIISDSLLLTDFDIY